MICELVGLDNVRATLRDDGVWESDNRGRELLLNKMFNAILYPPSPSAGISTYATQAVEAAAYFDATIVWSDQTIEERVY